MGDLGAEDTDKNTSLGIFSPTETDSLECMDGGAIVTSTRKTATPALGAWIKEHHQTQEWYYDAKAKTIYHHTNGQWEIHQAQNIGRLRFCTICTPCGTPSRITHIINTAHRAGYIEIVHQDEIWRYGKNNQHPSSHTHPA
jgi:5-methylcytosine-specific restriction endonuclease McrA